MTLIDANLRWPGKCLSVSRSDIAVFYWETEIKTPEICEAYGVEHPNRLSGRCGPAVLAGEFCKHCSNALLVYSRSDAEERLRNKDGVGRRTFEGHVCRNCRDVEKSIREEKWRRESEGRRRRAWQLKTMPYLEYLATPEWKDRAERAKRSVGYRCQTCASKGQLHVHHRTYARRGEEWNKDLIVLCSDCHELFHSQRRLADGGRAA